MTLLAVQPACIGSVAFGCERDEQCDQGAAGLCIDQYCAAQDGACPSGYRYSEHSPFGASCTPEGTTSGTSSASSDGSRSASGESSGSTGSGVAGCVVDIQGARGQLCALTQDGAVQCWGDTAALVARDALEVYGTAEQLSVGTDHACVRDGDVLCWGNNATARFAAADERDDVFPPLVIEGSDVPAMPRAVAAGQQSTCIASATGARCTGAIAGNDPVVFDFGSDAAIVQIAGGRRHTCAIDEAGAVWCAGDNTSAQLGTTQQTDTVVAVPGLPAPATALSTTRDSTCALLAQDELWCWGRREQGVIPGGGDPTPPIAVAQDIVAFDVGLPSGCAVSRSGEVRCVGAYLCDESGSESFAAYTSVAAVGDVAALQTQAVAVGDGFMCLLAADATVMCWGRQVVPSDGLCSDLRPLPVACE